MYIWRWLRIQPETQFRFNSLHKPDPEWKPVSRSQRNPLYSAWPSNPDVRWLEYLQKRSFVTGICCIWNVAVLFFFLKFLFFSITYNYFWGFIFSLPDIFRVLQKFVLWYSTGACANVSTGLHRLSKVPSEREILPIIVLILWLPGYLITVLIISRDYFSARVSWGNETASWNFVFAILCILGKFNFILIEIWILNKHFGANFE